MSISATVTHPISKDEFVERVEDLLFSIFPSEVTTSFEWTTTQGLSPYYVLRGSLDSIHKIKLTVTDQATVAIFYRTIPDIVGGVKELDRSALRNEPWTDLQGWIFKIKTDYDRISKQIQSCTVMKEFHLFETSGEHITLRFNNKAEITGDYKKIRLEGQSSWKTISSHDIFEAVEKRWLRVDNVQLVGNFSI